MTNLEIEYKVLVSKADFNKLEASLISSFELFDQTNYYYDSSDKILKNNGLSLRIRCLNNKGVYITTLKESLSVGRMEYEYTTDTKKIADEVILLLNSKNIDTSKLIELGSLRTIRKEYKIDGCNLCLDISSYNDNIDYEIECEAPSMKKAKEVITNLLSKYNIEFVESKYSKQQRALNNK